ncbi:MULTISPECIES: cysteine desulfurase [unclassified Arcicella]|uniref:cysteine desulfurase n=1 Tax=unclassified Arcicella TaxID=2644986 RepID=UPI002863BC77|nr:MULTISPECIES: cysteine desulfurase [unclassified Arcicella]MDR6563099.1 cysteine desulfurase/selenocysteine lyase [Arcicella sp. BE51]MDR6811750.1 cysteine desulfurase/selenocysteine lyase [Arcicella sp. BE140]MDR6823275.1 cysteine desulfurase/selenocysteine lyase [Arcicella sp. BE139]
MITTDILDIQKIRADFPILEQEINGKKLVYFDNAATTQKPTAVIDAIAHYYNFDNANIHRGIHTLAERATRDFEASREAVREFLGASSTEEIIFTSGTTQGINLVASTFGRKFIKEGDEIIVSGMEHHSNIVPWQMLCEEKGITLKVIPVTEQGELDMEAYENLLSEKVKLVAVNHVSNSLGTINPVKEIIALAHEYGAKVLIDGAQATSHFNIDVQDLDADFYAFSAHKLYGPTGMGALYGKKELLNAMPPYMGGGEMIKDVTFEKTTYNELPYKFEAGTPNIADVVALKTALEYADALGRENIAAHEDMLLSYATEQLSEIEGLRIIGQAKKKVSVLSFVIDGIHHQDIGVLLDNQGIAVRTGHHCTQPLMQRFNLLGTSRASFAVYNTIEEIDRLVAGIHRVKKMLL